MQVKVTKHNWILEEEQVLFGFIKTGYKTETLEKIATKAVNALNNSEITLGPAKAKVVSI